MNNGVLICVQDGLAKRKICRHYHWIYYLIASRGPQEASWNSSRPLEVEIKGNRWIALFAPILSHDAKLWRPLQLFSFQKCFIIRIKFSLQESRYELLEPEVAGGGRTLPSSYSRALKLLVTGSSFRGYWWPGVSGGRKKDGYQYLQHYQSLSVFC